MEERKDWYEPENRTDCPDTGGPHQWIWIDEKDDYQCDECGVMCEHQEE